MIYNHILLKNILEVMRNIRSALADVFAVALTFPPIAPVVPHGDIEIFDEEYDEHDELEIF